MNTREQQQFEYLLRLGDSDLILGQRLSAWLGHAPVLEEEMATGNVALDLVGQARSWLSLAGELEAQGRDADRLAYFRDAFDYRNVLITERPNGDYAYTIMRQFLFDAYHYPLLQQLSGSAHEGIREVAAKSVKEVEYHVRRSSEWVIRMGDGTQESHQRIQAALDDLWMYTGEMLTPDDVDDALLEAGVGADLEQVARSCHDRVRAVTEEATLTLPDESWMQQGGKQGRHTEHLGYILAEMQHLPRSYPDARW